MENNKATEQTISNTIKAANAVSAANGSAALLAITAAYIAGRESVLIERGKTVDHP